MIPDFGTDFLVFDEMPPDFRLSTGDMLVLAAVYRRWTTDPDSVAGARIYKGRCRDIRRLLAARYNLARLTALATELGQVARDDERVDDASAVFESDPAGRTVRLRGEVRPVGDAAAIRFVIPFDSFKPEVLLGR